MKISLSVSYRYSCVFLLKNKINEILDKSLNLSLVIEWQSRQESQGDQANLAFVIIVLVTPTSEPTCKLRV